jgi:hypothetical protein
MSLKVTKNEYHGDQYKGGVRCRVGGSVEDSVGRGVV